MKARSLVLVAALVVVAGFMWWLQPGRPPTDAPLTRPPSTSPGVGAPGALSPAPAALDAPGPAAISDLGALADHLNAPAGTVQRDVRILDDIFTQWITNFPRQGNPAGTNAEITAALTGKNKLGLVLLPPDHPAISRDGELVDRWGTPFRFHQWSGQVMEIVSAGPDRKFATADDVSSQ